MSSLGGSLVTKTNTVNFTNGPLKFYNDAIVYGGISDSDYPSFTQDYNAYEYESLLDGTGSDTGTPGIPTSIVANGNYIVVGSSLHDSGLGSDSGCAYIYETTDGGKTFTATQIFRNTNIVSGGDYVSKRFGYACAIDGDTIAITSFRVGANTNAACYIFKKVSGNWSRQCVVTPSSSETGDQFGYSVSLYGDYLAVGVPNYSNGGANGGRVCVFKTIDNWTTDITAEHISLTNSSPGDLYGRSVSLYNGVLAIGALGTTSATGSVYIHYENEGAVGNWGLKKTLTGSTAGDKFGISVSLYGDYLLIGASEATYDSNSKAGRAFLHHKDEGGADIWNQITEITRTDSNVNDYFGTSVSLTNGKMVIGQYGDDDKAGNAGAIYVYIDSAGTWTQDKKITACNAANPYQFGINVSITTNFVVSLDKYNANTAYAYNTSILTNVDTDINGDGVFSVLQFSNYPYDPFTTLSVTDDWLEVGAERNTVDGTWTVSFRTKDDNLYNISPTALGGNYVKLADFVGGTSYPLTSDIVNGFTDIMYGFYDNSICRYNAYYFKPSSGNNDYISYTDADFSDTIVSPSVSTTYEYTPDHHTVSPIYNPDTIASADGERVTKLTDLDISLNSYGSIVSLYTQHLSSNGLYLGNDTRYNGWDSSPIDEVIPYDDGSNTVNYVKSITITSPSFDSNTTYFTSPASGWYYYQSIASDNTTVTLHFDATGNVATTPGTVDSLQIAQLNITGTNLTNFINQLIVASDGSDPATFNIYYTNVTATSSTDTYFERYKASQTGYDGIFQFRVKEDSSTYSLNPENYLINSRGAFYDTGKALYVPRHPSTAPSNIDATEWFGRNIQLYIRLEGKLYIVNGKRYNDSTTDIFPYDPYDDTVTYNQSWTGLKKYSMTSTLFNSGTTYFTLDANAAIAGWTYTQTDNGDGTVTLSFEYTGTGYTVTDGTAYIAKSNINVDILSGIMRSPYSTTDPYVTYSYEYYGSDGTLVQQGYDGIMGTSVNDTYADPIVDGPDYLYAIDEDKNTIDIQGLLFSTALGDPHVRPINGSPYDLPHEEETFVLYSNNDTDYPVSIKGKCWYLPEYKYMKKINRLNAIGYHDRAERYLELFKENTYFKYLEFVCGPEHVIIDMDRLRPCTFTSMEDLHNHNLPLAEGYYENNKYINLSGFKHSKTGIIISKKPMKTTLDRVITMRGKESLITLRMIWDTRDIINRNGVEIKVRGLKQSDVGSLVRECVIYSQFGLNYNMSGSYDQEIVKKSTKVYSASSYGATETIDVSKENITFEQPIRTIQKVL